MMNDKFEIMTDNELQVIDGGGSYFGKTFIHPILQLIKRNCR